MIIWKWLFDDYLIMIICNYLKWIIWTHLSLFWLFDLFELFELFDLFDLFENYDDYLIIIWIWLFVIFDNDYL